MTVERWTTEGGNVKTVGEGRQGSRQGIEKLTQREGYGKVK